MLLSVGMIVKNEEKYLERCLSALKPLLDNLDSELIIADTGSTDNTVEIAKRYTDKVYYFEWINDFSAARNFTLNKSSGKWFMFIDADEILQSCDDIIRFFKSGEYKSFKNASYIVRSFTDEADLNIYLDSTAVRLAERCGNVSFVNEIHEAFATVYMPVKQLNAVAYHYGYFFKNGGKVTEQAYRKSQRNLDLLLKNLKKDKTDLSIYKEISDCYRMIGDWNSAYKYIDLGLKCIKDDHIGITQYYDCKASLAIELKHYDEVIEVCNDYFKPANKFRKGIIATDADMYAYRAQAYYCKDMYDKAIDDLQSFIKVYKEYRSGKLKTGDLIYNPLQMNDSNFKILCKMLFKSYIALGKYNTALESFKLLPLEICFDDEKYMFEYFLIRADVMEHTRYGGIKKLAQQLDAVNRGRFFRTLRWKMFTTERPQELLKALSEAKGIDVQLDDAAAIYDSYFVRRNTSFTQISDFIQKHGTKENYEMLCIMLSEGMDIAPFISKGDFDIFRCADVLYSDYPQYTHLLETYDTNVISANALTVAETFWGRAMVEMNNSGRSVLRLFEKYGEIAARWRKEFPYEEKIPAEIKAGIIINGITEAYSRKNYPTCVNELRSLVNNYKEFAPFASQYLEMINAETAPPKNDPMAELRQLAAVVKANINAMLNAGQIIQAEQTLLELEKLCPDDVDIFRLKEEIKSRKLL